MVYLEVRSARVDFSGVHSGASCVELVHAKVRELYEGAREQLWPCGS